MNARLLSEVTKLSHRFGLRIVGVVSHPLSLAQCAELSPSSPENKVCAGEN